MGVVLVAVAGGGYLYIRSLDSNLRKGALHEDPKAQVAASQPDKYGHTPLNILLIGSDGRTSRADCKLGGSCDDSPPHADVEMLVHLSADRSNASILSIPRDTRVDLADCQGHNNRTNEQITDSLNFGGPACVVDTWQKLAKIRIDHYMMIDFAGVVSMADAIKGVQVCAKQNVFDYQVTYDKTGRHEIGSHLLYPAGSRKIQGEQALEWLRTRHAFGDGSDLGRATAQHLYLNSMLRQMKSVGTLTNISEMNGLAVAATKALQVDDKITGISSLLDLALQFNKIDPKRMTTMTIPTHYGSNPGNPANLPVLLTQPASDQIFTQIRDDVPFDKNAAAAPATTAPTPSATVAAPATATQKAAVQLTVQNFSGVDKRGLAITDSLVAQGFTHATRDTRNDTAAATTLTYPTAQKAQAQAVATALGLKDPALIASSTATRLTLVIGTDWKTGNRFVAAALPPAAAPPTGTETQNAADDTQCMSVNPAYLHGKPEYSWPLGGTPPVVPQP
jgi:LCP family protein required for cell wall assembly